MLNIHYALQTCDISSNQNTKRYAAETKTEITRKCVSSFLYSVEYAAKISPDSNHVIAIFDDNSKEETVEFLQRCVDKFNRDNISVELIRKNSGGIMKSIGACYDWLEDNGIDLVYQVQDDYLFQETAIFEIIDIFVQLNIDTKSDSVVCSYNDPRYWAHEYRYKVTPRTIIPGVNRYWIQLYELPCTFLTSKSQFLANRDILNKFLSCDPKDPRLEAISLNKILTQRGVLGLAPMESVGLHMQSETEKDPYIDWKSRWDSIELV